MGEWSNLAKIIYKRTYARKDNGSLENWKDTVDRVISGNIKNHNVSEKEIKRLEYFLKNRKAGPAGRGWWFSGAPAHSRLGGSALNNCWFLTSDNWENLVIGQDLLMLGGGVGLSVEHRYTSKLPKVKKDVNIVHKATKDADFIVPDSREGWCKLTSMILESFLETGKSFSYSTVCIRGYGEPISGFGGTSSGPIPLVQFAEKACKILSSRAGKNLEPLNVADIFCAIGEMVVMGNVRRSAIIIIGDPFDKDYLKAKRWDLGTLPTQRAMANYSVICNDVEDLHPLFWKTYELGEAFGIVNLSNIQKYGRMGELKKDTARGTNPCQPSYATVLTKNGISTIGNINIGDFIWSGCEWTKVIKKWSTGIKPVLKYNTTRGSFIGTENHRILQNGEKIEVKDATNIDSVSGPDVETCKINIFDVMDGLVIGDGSVHKASNNLVVLYIGEKDKDYFDSEIKDLILKKRLGISKNVFEVKTSINYLELPKTFLREVPDRFFYGSTDKKISFLRGLFSANGTVVDNRISIKQSSKILIEQVYQMLSSIGINSYITINKPKSVEFSNGPYECKQSYDLNITSDREKFVNLIGFIQKYKNDKIKITKINPKIISSDIKEVEYLEDTEVFDITVDCNEHTYWTGGCLVSNCGEATLESKEACNLQEIALPNLNNLDEFVEAGILMHRWGKRVACENYHHLECDEVIKRNRRIGTGITGCLQSPLFNPKDLDIVYQAIQKENISYSKELSIPQSIRTTVVKPSGTISKLLDMRGYEGIHPAYSRYFIQRVRFASNDPLIPLLKEAGHKIEPVIKFDNTIDHTTVVVDFYENVPREFPVADENWDTWKQLEVVKMVQKYWSDQSVSVTVYYRREELAKLKEWLKDNLQYIKTISFLCYNDHGFKQAPKEKITKEQFDVLSGNVKSIDVNKIGDHNLLDNLECEGGACPIK